jgi:hypothetical protein
MRLWEDSGNLEHLSGTFTVRGSDDWGVDVKETSLLEEQVSSKSKVVANTSHGTDCVSTRA